jgi:hypothetical protein
MVTEAIRREEVDAVLANLHFCDNTAMTGEDRYYKVKVFLLITFEGTFTSVFKDKKSQKSRKKVAKKSQNIRYKGFMLLIFCLMIE